MVNAVVSPVLQPPEAGQDTLLPGGRTAPMSLTLGLLEELRKTGRAHVEDDPHGACWYLTPEGITWYQSGNQTGDGTKTGNRTGDEIMTPPKSPAAKARAKQLAAAKRSLSLIAGEVAAAQAALENGGVPDRGFMASVLKYDQALAVIIALDALGEAPAPDGGDGLAEVSRDDLTTLIGVLKGLVPAGLLGSGDTPLARLEAAAAGPPWDTEPQSVPPQPPVAPEPE
jgi:hypothetical protein